MQRHPPDEFWIIEMIYAKHPYLRALVNERIPSRILGLAVILPTDINTRHHVPVFDDELRRFVREWIGLNATQRTCCAEENAVLCLVPLQ